MNEAWNEFKKLYAEVISDAKKLYVVFLTLALAFGVDGLWFWNTEPNDQHWAGLYIVLSISCAVLLGVTWLIEESSPSGMY